MLGLSQIFGKETVVGLDIGSRYIKVVQAEPGSANRWRLTKAAIAPTPPEAIRDGIIVNKPAVGDAIRALLRSAGIDANGAVAAISGASVIVRHVKMPRMNEIMLRKSVRYEAAKHIPSSVDDSMIEFAITGAVPEENDKMGVMLVAAPNEMVEARLGTLLAAGLEPVAIDIEAFALQRALLDLSATKPGEGITVALLDIGAVTTEVNIVTNGQFALTRNIAIAGDNFSNALKSISRRTEFADLEALKYQVDMAALLDAEADPEAVTLAQAVQPVMDELLREVRRSTNYYQSQLTDTANSNLPVGVTAETGGSTVTKIVLTGGGARMKGLEAYMAARLGMTIEIWNVFDNPAFDTTALAPDFIAENHAQLTTGVGLALKELTHSSTAEIAAKNDTPKKQKKSKLAQAA